MDSVDTDPPNRDASVSADEGQDGDDDEEGTGSMLQMTQNHKTRITTSLSRPHLHRLSSPPSCSLFPPPPPPSTYTTTRHPLAPLPNAPTRVLTHCHSRVTQKHHVYQRSVTVTRKGLKLGFMFSGLGLIRFAPAPLPSRATLHHAGLDTLTQLLSRNVTPVRPKLRLHTR